ncbi:MAG: tetratricopeptide repeat protein [Muribaculaceae bacterium]
MMNYKSVLVALIMCVAMPTATFAADKQDGNQEDKSLKSERNFIRQGNKYYKDKRYGEAEVEYKKALQVNPGSNVANYNLASALIRQGGGVKANDKEDKNNPVNQAQTILSNLVKTCPNSSLVSKAYYNLGNINYNREEYSEAVENYKNCLRRNPDDDKARENLRLAQLKLQQQQDENQNKNQQQKQQQDQQQQQNQDNEDKKEKDQNQQNQSQQRKDGDNKENKENQSGMSQDNIDQILKTMQNQEGAIQQKINARKANQQKASGRKTGNQW